MWPSFSPLLTVHDECSCGVGSPTFGESKRRCSAWPSDSYTKIKSLSTFREHQSWSLTWISFCKAVFRPESNTSASIRQNLGFWDHFEHFLNIIDHRQWANNSTSLNARKYSNPVFTKVLHSLFFLVIPRYYFFWINHWFKIVPYNYEARACKMYKLHEKKISTLMSSMNVIRRPQGCGRLTINLSSNTRVICSWIISWTQPKNCKFLDQWIDTICASQYQRCYMKNMITIQR